MVERAFIASVPCAALVALAWASGGYFAETWGVALLAEAVAIAVWAILASTIEVPRSSVALVGGLLVLAGWQVVSRAWAFAPDAAVLEAERTLLYAGAAAAAVLTIPRRRIDDLVLGVLAGTGIVTVGGLLQHVLGSGVPDGRLESPVGYSNAAGILAAATLLLALGLAADGPAWRRSLAAGVAPAAAVVLYLSLSRGAVVACALGLLVLAVSIRPAPSLVRAGLVGSIAGLAALGAGLAGTFGDRGVSTAELVSLGAVAALGGVAAAVAASSPAVRGLGVAAIEVDARRLRGRPGRRRTRRGGGRRRRRPGGALRTGRPAARAGQVAVDIDELSRGLLGRRGGRWSPTSPSLGEGAGGFGRIWLRDRPALLFVRDAHNLYLETLAEVGPVGLIALLVALLVPLTVVRRAMREPVGRACLAAYLALLAHAALDWDWELPAVTVCTVLLAVALVKHGEPIRAPRAVRRPARASLLAAAAALGVAAVVVRAGNGAIVAARDAVDRGDVPSAIREAERARRFAPWAAEPWQLLGEADAAAGRLADARRHLRRAVDEDPRSSGAWLALAFATSGPEQARAIAEVRRLDPLAPELEAFDDH